MQHPETYKLTVKLPFYSRRYLYILKKRMGYKSLDRLVADMVDEKTQQMFSASQHGNGIESY